MGHQILQSVLGPLYNLYPVLLEIVFDIGDKPGRHINVTSHKCSFLVRARYRTRISEGRKVDRAGT